MLKAQFKVTFQKLSDKIINSIEKMINMTQNCGFSFTLYPFFLDPTLKV